MTRSRVMPGSPDPFAVLGLPADPAALSDDDVRAAWRRVAAATHPDRPDGGDPDTFAAAATAYTTLRTRFGRTEALADLRAAPPAAARPARWVAGGRPVRLAARILAGAGFSVLVAAADGWQPATLALILGAVITVARTARHDLPRR